jgi:hypothetical protein
MAAQRDHEVDILSMSVDSIFVHKMRRHDKNLSENLRQQAEPLLQSEVFG